MISTPCWPGPGFIRVKQLRVYARNINDGDTLCDPPHKGSLVTTKDSCEATGPASQTGEGSRGPDLARETTAGPWQRGAPWRGSSRDSAQSSRAPGVPVMLYFFVWVLVSQVFSVYELSLIKNIYFPVWMIHCNQNSKVEKVRAA